MNNKLTKREREHFALIKSMPCSVCGQSGPSEAHHIRQHLTFTCIPLCYGCHRDNFNGIHGQKRMWAIHKLDELSALNKTYETIFKNM